MDISKPDLVALCRETEDGEEQLGDGVPRTHRPRQARAARRPTRPALTVASTVVSKHVVRCLMPSTGLIATDDLDKIGCSFRHQPFERAAELVDAVEQGRIADAEDIGYALMLAERAVEAYHACGDPDGYPRLITRSWSPSDRSRRMSWPRRGLSRWPRSGTGCGASFACPMMNTTTLPSTG